MAAAFKNKLHLCIKRSSLEMRKVGTSSLREYRIFALNSGKKHEKECPLENQRHNEIPTESLRPKKFRAF